jgi:integrase
MDSSASKKRRPKGEGSWGKKTIKDIEYFHFRKKYNGKYKDFYGLTQREVKEKIKSFESSNHYLTNKEIKKQTLKTYIEDWLYNVRINEVEKSSFLTNKKTYENQIKGYEPVNMQMATLDSDIIQKHINILASKYSRSTVSKAYFLYNLCFDYALTKRDILSNPMTTVKMPSESNVSNKKKEYIIPEPEDIDLLFNEAGRLNVAGFCFTGKEGTRVYGDNAYAIVLVSYTGIRIGELLALEWQDVSIENQEMIIRRAASSVEKNDNGTTYIIKEIKTPKTKNSYRTIPLPERAITALKELEKSNPDHKPTDKILLGTNGKPKSERNITRTLNAMQVRAKCKVSKCGMHSIRKAYGLMLLLNGVDIKTISVLMGHASVSLTMDTYIGYIKKMGINAKDVLNKMNNKIDEE